jgi:hypothetical protein
MTEQDPARQGSTLQMPLGGEMLHTWRSQLRLLDDREGHGPLAYESRLRCLISLSVKAWVTEDTRNPC